MGTVQLVQLSCLLGVTFSVWSCHTFPAWQETKLIILSSGKRRGRGGLD